MIVVTWPSLHDDSCSNGMFILACLETVVVLEITLSELCCYRLFKDESLVAGNNQLQGFRL